MECMCTLFKSLHTHKVIYMYTVHAHVIDSFIYKMIYCTFYSVYKYSQWNAFGAILEYMTCLPNTPPHQLTLQWMTVCAQNGIIRQLWVKTTFRVSVELSGL